MTQKGIETLRPSNTEYDEMRELESLTGQATEVSPWTFQKTPQERQEYVRGQTKPQKQLRAGAKAIATDPMTYAELLIPGVGELESIALLGEEIEEMKETGFTWKGFGLSTLFTAGAIPLFKPARLVGKKVKSAQKVGDDELVPRLEDKPTDLGESGMETGTGVIYPDQKLTNKELKELGIKSGPEIQAPVFFSSADKYLKDRAPNKATASQWLAFNVDGSMRSGLLRSIDKKTGRPFVSAREIEESGVKHLLKRIHAKDPNQIVTKDEILKLINEHPSNNLKMILLSKSPYRKNYITKEFKSRKRDDADPLIGTEPKHSGDVLSSTGENHYGEMILHVDEIPGQPNQFGSHFQQVPNMVVWQRFTDRVGEGGEKIRFIEEIQSDIHQGARKAGTELSEKGILRTHSDGAYKKTKHLDEIDTTEKTKEIREVQEFVKDYVEKGDLSDIKPKNIDKLVDRQIKSAQSRKKDQFDNLDKDEYEEYVTKSGGSPDDLFEDIPLKGKDYADTSLKAQMRLAAEEGQEWLAIKPAPIHSYSKGLYKYDRKIANWPDHKQTYQGDLLWYGTPDGKSSRSHGIQVFNKKTGNDYAVDVDISPDQQVIPSLFKKYAKDYNSEVKTIRFFDGDGRRVDAFAIKVTPDMKNPFPIYHKKEGGLVTLWTKPIF